MHVYFSFPFLSAIFCDNTIEVDNREHVIDEFLGAGYRVQIIAVNLDIS